MFSEKCARPPSYENPLKILRHLVQMLAIRILVSNGAHWKYKLKHVLKTFDDVIFSYPVQYIDRHQFVLLMIWILKSNVNTDYRDVFKSKS